MKKTKLIWLLISTLLSVVGIVVIGISVYKTIAFEKTECVVEIISEGKSEDHTIITYADYEYNGIEYDDVRLRNFNAFTMKDGEKVTVYIDPDDPDTPHTQQITLWELFFFCQVLLQE